MALRPKANAGKGLCLQSLTLFPFSSFLLPLCVCYCLFNGVLLHHLIHTQVFRQLSHNYAKYFEKVVHNVLCPIVV